MLPIYMHRNLYEFSQLHLYIHHHTGIGGGRASASVTLLGGGICGGSASGMEEMVFVVVELSEVMPASV